MLASFIAIRPAPNQVLLVTSRDILAPTLKRLSMFVLRAKAKLRVASAEFDLHGIAGAAAESLAPQLREPWSLAQADGATAIARYPADAQRRILWIAAAGGAK